MTYQICYQIVISLCLAGIITGLLSYILIADARHPFIGRFMENLALQAMILCAMLVVALVSMRGGYEAKFFLSLFRVWLYVSAFNIIRTSISLLCV